MQFTTLIDPHTLAEHLNHPSLCIVDCRHDLADPGFGRRAYADAHLPGAHFLHVDDDLSGPRSGRNGRHPLPDPHQLATRLGACGIDRNTQVVAYDDSGGMYAARLWWLLRWLGHGRVAVLDGGLQSWQRHGGALEQRTPSAEARQLDVNLQPIWVDVDIVLGNLSGGSLMLVDARSPDRYRGENESLDPVGGHIPGARNRFFRDNLNPEGVFKSPEQLQQDFRKVLGEQAVEQVVHQCGSGITACHNLLAMEVAGLPGARLYPGSWSEWCADPDRPVASGSQAA